MPNFISLHPWHHQSSNLSVFGHSLGAFVASEIGSLYGGIHSLVALDPAYPWRVYDIDKLVPGHQSVKRFDQVSKNSTAFVIADQYTISDYAGDTGAAASAKASFLVETSGLFIGPIEAHGAVVEVFADMLGRGITGISGYTENSFSDDGNPLTLIGKSHEGIIYGSKQEDKWSYKNNLVYSGDSFTYWV